MSVRLQVLLPESELDEIRAVARQHEQTVSEWVRGALRKARAELPRRSIAHKLAAIRQASTYEFPSADIDTMLAEIERGYPTALPE